jgi:hypothetical protein
LKGNLIMKRRDVLTGAAALAVASVVPALPAIAMPVAKPVVAEKKIFVLFMKLAHGFAVMRVMSAETDTKKGSLLKSQWSRNYLIREDADPEIPKMGSNENEVSARIVRRTAAQVDKLMYNNIPCADNMDEMLKTARLLDRWAKGLPA